MMNIMEKVDIKRHLNFGVGGIVDRMIIVSSFEEVVLACEYAKKENLKTVILGGGYNTVFSSDYFDGVVIKISGGEIKKSKETVICGAGASLQELIDFSSREGLAGLESLSGIPGTVGGAIFGNAGAYGRSISDNLLSVTVYTGEELKTLKNDDCFFSYRSSLFKEKDWVIISAEFEFTKGDSEALKKKSSDILNTRWKKFGKMPRCPGSYFKNVLASELTKEVLSKIDETKIIEGKIPAGYLIESVGGKGICVGDIEVSSFHGNVIINKGSGTYSDLEKLVKILKDLVFQKFGIVLEEEVVCVDQIQKK